jgi:hypothetical protein
MAKKPVNKPTPTKPRPRPVPPEEPVATAWPK